MGICLDSNPHYVNSRQQLGQGTGVLSNKYITSAGIVIISTDASRLLAASDFLTSGYMNLVKLHYQNS